jgi:hypothetical protein
MPLTLTIAFNYIESFFNAFQGFVVAVACCFIQRDVRIEALIFICKCFKSASCYAQFPFCHCFNPDYITKLRQKNRDNRSSIASLSQRMSSSLDKRRSLSHLSEAGEDLSFNSSSRAASINDSNGLSTSLLSTATILPKSLKIKKKDTIVQLVKKDSTSSLPSIKNGHSTTKCFTVDCLFDNNHRNDFYQSSHRHLTKKPHSSNDSNVNKTNGNSLSVKDYRSESNSSSDTIVTIPKKESRYNRLFTSSRKYKDDNNNNNNNKEDTHLLKAPLGNSSSDANECNRISKVVHFNENDSRKASEIINNNNNENSNNKSFKKSNIKYSNIKKSSDILVSNNDNKYNEASLIIKNINLNRWPLIFESINTFIDDDNDEDNEK